MALTPRSGFSNTTSGQNDVPNEIPNSQSDVLNNMPFVTDTNLNKYAIDTGAYPNTTKMLVGFIKGKRVVVTYYRRLREGGSNLRTNIADYATTRNIIDTEFQKILNLEITLPKGLDFEADPTKASIGVTGEAMFYPNMNPSVGDIFSMGVGDGRVGVFQIASVTPMSWRTDRIYTVTFVLQSFLDSSDSDPIEGAVTITSVFSKENYLGGTAALLSEQTYLQLLKIREVRGNLCKYYHQSFFDTELCSYVRPDGLYDPCAVQFIINKITMDDLHARAKLLTGNNPKLYKVSLWSRLEDRFNTTLYGIAAQARVAPYNQTRMGVFVTELFGRQVVTPEKDLTDYDPYIFSDKFYAGTIADMNALELRMYNAITQRTAGDLGTFISDFLDTVYSLPMDEQYYKIPLYIHLIDMALQSQYREIDAPSMSYGSTGE